MVVGAVTLVSLGSAPRGPGLSISYRDLTAAVQVVTAGHTRLVPADNVHPQVFRSTFWRGVALIWLPILGFTVWDLANRGFPPSGRIALSVMGAISVLVYAVGWRPAVLASDREVVVRNPFRTTTIPWGAVTDIDLTDALRIHTASGTTRAWSVDRGGAASNMMRGIGSRRIAAGGLERTAVEAMARRSPADYAVAALVETWRRRRGETRGTAEIEWAWPVLGAFVGLCVLSAVLLAT